MNAWLTVPSGSWARFDGLGFFLGYLGVQVSSPDSTRATRRECLKMQRKSHASRLTTSTSAGVAMIIEWELREEIARALSGEVSLNELYSWLMARSWNMNQNSNAAAIDLAGDVEELFFERADGYRDDESVRNSLSCLLNNIVIEASMGDAIVVAPHTTAVSFPIWLPLSSALKLPRFVPAGTTTTALLVAEQT